MDFWLQDEDSNILDLGANVQQMNLGNTSRSYKVVPFAGAPGGSIRGFGSPGGKKFVISRKEKAESGDNSFWNSRRNDFVRFFSLPRWKQQWLYVRNGEDTFTVRTDVFTEQIGAEQFKYQRITDMKKFQIISPSGLFENIVASTDTAAITANQKTDVVFTNSGTWEAPIILKYTPTTDANVIQFQLADEFGVRLERVTFTAGQQVTYNTANNTMTIAGEEVQTSQFLTDGSVFNIPAGSVTIKVLSDASGTFAYEYNERYN